jgi:hypothetical protein
VKFTSKLFGRALSRRIKATVLYATETGKSEMYAKKLDEIFGHAFNSQVGLSFQNFIPKLNSFRLYRVLTMV